jgi:hypothetical protein
MCYTIKVANTLWDVWLLLIALCVCYDLAILLYPFRRLDIQSVMARAIVKVNVIH